MKGLVYLVLGVSAVVVLAMVLKNKEYFVKINSRLEK